MSIWISLVVRQHRSREALIEWRADPFCRYFASQLLQVILRTNFVGLINYLELAKKFSFALDLFHNFRRIAVQKKHKLICIFGFKVIWFNAMPPVTRSKTVSINRSMATHPTMATFKEEIKNKKRYKSISNLKFKSKCFQLSGKCICCWFRMVCMMTVLNTLPVSYFLLKFRSQLRPTVSRPSAVRKIRIPRVSLKNV